MKHKLKFICVIFVAAISSNSFGQSSKCKDTLTIIFRDFKDYCLKLDKAYSSGIYLNDTIFYVKNVKAKKEGIPLLDAFNKGNMYVCEKKDKFKYSLFFDRSNKLIAEGIWDLEGFHGIYKEYYTNGKLKVEGYRNGDSKIKTWKYYSEKGEAIKEETYDEKGVLLSTKNF